MPDYLIRPVGEGGFGGATAYGGVIDGVPLTGLAPGEYNYWLVTPGDGTVTVTEVVAAPGQVTGLTATPGDGQVTLGWNAPAANGSAITDYEIEVATDGVTFSTVADGVGTATGHVHTATNGVAHTYRVRAVNGVGPGAWSAAATATPNEGQEPDVSPAIRFDGVDDRMTWSQANVPAATLVMRVRPTAADQFATILNQPLLRVFDHDAETPPNLSLQFVGFVRNNPTIGDVLTPRVYAVGDWLNIVISLSRAATIDGNKSVSFVVNGVERSSSLVVPAADFELEYEGFMADDNGNNAFPGDVQMFWMSHTAMSPLDVYDDFFFPDGSPRPWGADGAVAGVTPTIARRGTAADWASGTGGAGAVTIHGAPTDVAT